MRRLLSYAALLAIAVTPMAAQAGPSDEVLAAATNFQALKFWHADEAVGGRTMSIDFAAPDRFRLQMPMGTQYMIGSDVYLTVAGHTMKMPMPQAGAMIAQLRSPAAAANFAKNHTIRDLGASRVGDVPTHAYAFDDTTNGVTTHNVLDIGPHQLPYRMTVDSGKSKVTITYSKFGEPVTINPPS
jgi:hypothetical protein